MDNIPEFNIEERFVIAKGTVYTTRIVDNGLTPFDMLCANVKNQMSGLVGKQVNINDKVSNVLDIQFNNTGGGWEGPKALRVSILTDEEFLTKE